MIKTVRLNEDEVRKIEKWIADYNKEFGIGNEFNFSEVVHLLIALGLPRLKAKDSRVFFD